MTIKRLEAVPEAQKVTIGVGLGVIMGNLTIGVVIGVAIGTAIGSGLEKKHKDEIRPITDEEKKLKKQSILFSISTMIIGIVVFVITYFVTKYTLNIKLSV